MNNYFSYNQVTTKDQRYQIFGGSNSTQYFDFLQLESAIPWTLNKRLKVN